MLIRSLIILRDVLVLADAATQAAQRRFLPRTEPTR